MTLPSQTYKHYTKHFSKCHETLKWESRLRFVRELYRIHQIGEITSSTAVKEILANIAFNLSFMDMCIRTHLPKSEQSVAITTIHQILIALDQISIRLSLLPKRNKTLAKSFVSKEFPTFFWQMENILCDIEVQFAASHTPLHRYSEQFISPSKNHCPNSM